MEATAGRQFVELKGCSPTDPNGVRTATVLSAYFHAEHMKAFRRLLWRRLAVGAILWLSVARMTSLLSHAATVVGWALIGGAGMWAAVVEWRADRRLSGLLADLPD